MKDKKRETITTVGCLDSVAKCFVCLWLEFQMQSKATTTTPTIETFKFIKKKYKRRQCVHESFVCRCLHTCCKHVEFVCVFVYHVTFFPLFFYSLVLFCRFFSFIHSFIQSFVHLFVWFADRILLATLASFLLSHFSHTHTQKK